MRHNLYLYAVFIKSQDNAHVRRMKKIQYPVEHILYLIYYDIYYILNLWVIFVKYSFHLLV